MTKAKRKVGLDPDTPHDSDLASWRDGYRRHLIGKGLDAETAAETAAKVAYRKDLYPTDAEAPLVETANQNKSGQGNLFTPQEARIVDSGLAISEEVPGGDDIAFLHSIMCQVGLPRSYTEEREFVRRSGDAWIMVSAGALDEGAGPVLQPLPYGAIPRLAMAWVSTYAVKNNTREIPVGHSAAEFLRNIGLDVDGGKRYAALRKQMHSLAASRIQLGYKGRTSNPSPMITSFDAWMQNGEHDQKMLWPGELLLSQEYFEKLLESATPLDRRALFALRGTALGLDVYMWLANRLHRIQGGPLVLKWLNLKEQFGQEYAAGKRGNQNFKLRYREALKQVLAVYPQARVKITDSGLILEASPPPISYREIEV